MSSARTDSDEAGTAPVVTAIDDHAAVELLRRLVETASLSGDEAAAAGLFVGAARDAGFRAWIDESGSAVAVRGGDRATVTIVLLGHIDTVAGEIEVRIEQCPEGPELWGRGSVDAKGSLAAFLVAASRAVVDERVRLVVVGATEEEAASSRGARHAAGVWRPDACIIGEPSGADGITLGYKGRLIAEYEVEVPAAHTAGPSASAADEAVAWWQRVLADVELWNNHRRSVMERRGEKPGVFDVIQASLRGLRTEGDGLRERAWVTAGFRMPPGYSPEEFEPRLMRLARTRESGVRAGVSCRGHERAHRSDRADACARALSQAIRARGGRPVPKVKTGTSDMNVVGPLWRCPIVAYGPGDAALDHTPEERLPLREFLLAAGTLAEALPILAGELLASADGAGGGGS